MLEHEAAWPQLVDQICEFLDEDGVPTAGEHRSGLPQAIAPEAADPARS
jgi:hypothetical protein